MMEFTDQVGVLANWFKGWNDCEQTVALYSLLKQIKKVQAKFLFRCLEHILSDGDNILVLEAEANNHDYVSHLLSHPNKAEVIKILLNRLPLLKPGNELAKNSYLQVLPNVLAFAIERSEYLEESRNLLSYSLIHPAFDKKERNLLTNWMSGFNGRSLPKKDIPVASPGELSPDNISAGNSLEPGVSLSEYSLNDHDETSPPGIKDYGSSLSLPSIGSNVTSPFMPAQVNDFNPSDGMADVKIWLKSLRLHKYEYLFINRSYEEMMNLTAHDLDAQNVTKGARNKIILSIKKLHERFAQLQSLENNILSGGSLRCALQELKTIIQTPIKRFESKDHFSSSDIGTTVKRDVIEDGDIPSLYTKVMGKACTQLLVSKPDEENITLYLKILEKCLQHQAFTEQHRKRLVIWKQQVVKMYRQLPKNRPSQSRSQPNVFSTKRPHPSRPFHLQQRVPTPRPVNPLPNAMRNVSIFQPPNMSWFASPTSLNPHPQPHIDVSRKTASLDPRLGQNMYRDIEDDDGDSPTSEITDRLTMLSHSVAELALSDLDGVSTL